MTVLTLPAELSSVARARLFVREAAPNHDTKAVAELLTSELVANVVRHAVTDVKVTVRVGPPFRVEVHDGVSGH